MNIIAIIPTHDRPEKFFKSFDSVLSQSLSADKIIVVHEDSDEYPSLIEKNKAYVTKNQRTKSLSGAVNHAIDQIIMNRHVWNINLESTWLALLDDDDWWDDKYLEKCTSIIDNDCNQVVSGIIRYDLNNPGGLKLTIPDSLNSESFLVKNPHIQGSNIFVRMDSFLKSGGFDESLLSCTDRDFNIRLFETKNHSWKKLNEHLVHHDARDEGRISDPMSQRKKDGLTRFGLKHQFRMNKNDWKNFLKISEERFGITPGDMKEKEIFVENKTTITPGKKIHNYNLTIGVTFSNMKLSKQFTGSLRRIFSEWPSKIRLIVCLHKIQIEEITPVLEELEADKFETIIYDESSGFELGKKGLLGPWFTNVKQRTGVSWGRCVLHRRIVENIENDERPLIWIVDEDMRIDRCQNKYSGNIGVDSFIEIISLMEKSKIDVGVGHVIGDPPINEIFTLRTQLVDLHYKNMAEKSNINHKKWSSFNPQEIHHDLSAKRYDHLEFPWGIFSIKGDNKSSLDLIRAGKCLSRPVHSNWRNKEDMDLIVRGGNTIILDPSTLSDWSNIAPLFGNIQTRRGDSLWSFFSQRIASRTRGKEKRKVKWIPFAMPQERESNKNIKHNLENIRGDIIGSMMIKELSLKFPPGCMDENRRKWIKGGWSEDISHKIVEKSRQREARLISSLYRVMTLESYLDSKTSVAEILEHLYHSDYEYELRNDIQKFLDELPSDMIDFRSLQPKIRPRYRIIEARRNLKKYANMENLDVKGDGSEGVVFKQNEKAVKVYHNDISLANNYFDHIKEIDYGSIKCLPDNFEILNIEPYIVSYDWVEGEHPEFQTNAKPWLDLLRESRENMFVYWDLKPLNLILTHENKLTIIDVGDDLKPFNEEDWESMVRKAYLCWRHWDKTNLKELLTKSLRNTDPESFPELRGIEDFREAIDIQDKSDLHDPWFVSIVGRNSGKILDWGCGSGRLTRSIAELGFEIDAYDPIIEYKKKVTANPNINWVDGPKDIGSNRYSVVISNLVLCEIESDDESKEVLNIISKSLESNGKALVTVCHPDSVNVRCSSTIERPPISLNQGKVTYTKIVRSTGRERLEHTRTLEKIREMANSVGLKINQTFNSPGMNIDDCTHTSEYLCIEFIKFGNKKD